VKWLCDCAAAAAAEAAQEMSQAGDEPCILLAAAGQGGRQHCSKDTIRQLELGLHAGKLLVCCSSKAGCRCVAALH
jgi:hypothetical protein